MKKSEKIINLILPVLTVVAILLLWTIASISIGSEYILPSVKDTALSMVGLLTSKKFLLAFLMTLIRSLIAFSVSFTLGFFMAILSQKIKYVERIVLTLMSILRALPTLAVILLLLFWTNNEVAPVLVTMLVVLPTCYTHLKSAMEGVDKTILEAGVVDGANKMQLFIKVEFPQIASAFFSAIGSGISLNFKLMVAAEVISATIKSLGNLLNNANYNADISGMLAMVCFAVVFGIVIEFIFNRISKKVSI